MSKNKVKCGYCKSVLSSKNALDKHQKTAIYCITVQNKKSSTSFKCEPCQKYFTQKIDLQRHEKICNKKEIYVLKLEYEQQISEKNNKIKELQNQLEVQLQNKDNHIKELEARLENIAIKAVQNPSYSNNFSDVVVTKENKEEEKIEIIKENTFEDISTIKINTCQREETVNLELENKIKELQTKLEEKEKYKQGTLAINGIIIEAREDGLINGTQMCKAWKKRFNNWFQTKETKDLIEHVVLNTGIPVFKIIEVTKGRYNSGSWIHPDLAVQLAQWLSPTFAIQVSRWTRELILTGSVSLSTQKTDEELFNLQKKILSRDRRVKYLENKILKKQKRIQYKDEFVMYIVTTESQQEKGIYKLGIAKNLTNRLSTYNSSEEHILIYHQSCGDKETMKLVENMVFHKLRNYRIKVNREIFKLKEEDTLDIFINTIKESVSFFDK